MEVQRGESRGAGVHLCVRGIGDTVTYLMHQVGPPVRPSGRYDESTKSSRMTPYPRVLGRVWPAFLVITVAAAFWAGSYLPDFSVEAGSDVLLNEDDQDLAYYNQTRADWASDEYVIVCCRREAGWFSKEGIDLLNSFMRELRAVPNVKSLTSMTTVPLLRNLRPGMIGPTVVTLANPKTEELDPRVDLEKAKAELVNHTQAAGN